MRTLLVSLLAAAHCLDPKFRLAADAGGAGGGTKTPSVADLQAQVTALTSDKAGLQTQLTAETAKVTDLTGQLTTEQGKVTDLTTRLTAETAKVTDLTGQVTTLKATAKDASTQGRELAAAHGSEAVPKDQASSPQNAATDGKAIYDGYQKLMTAGKSLEASEYYAKHEKELDAYAASLRRRD
jgi:chromosome segregation ATPase